MSLTTRLSVAFAVAAVALAPAAALAQTDDYPVTTSSATIDTSADDVAVVDGTVVAAADAEFTVAAGGFGAGAQVDGVLNSDPVDLGTETADANGDVAFDVELPGDLETGEHTITLTGDAPDGGTVVARTGLLVLTAADFDTVVAAGDLDVLDEGLADTGVDTAVAVAVAVVLLAAGGGALAFTRRRSA